MLSLVEQHETITDEQMAWYEYQARCEDVMRDSSNSRWKQGDLANEGEDEFPETYMDALTGKFGLAKGTIENRQRTARKFPEDKRLWDVDYMWYETLQAKDWATIVKHMDKVVAGEYETREDLRAEFRKDTDDQYTTCVLSNIATVLEQYGMDMKASVEVIFKGGNVRIKPVESEDDKEDDKIIELPQTLGLAS